uniref:Uncharacterized protein n=1 Tax=Lepeophtheirus salmonis TaxID=72036 RepID=A0A0K2VB54_LEPSM
MNQSKAKLFYRLNQFTMRPVQNSIRQNQIQF